MNQLFPVLMKRAEYETDVARSLTAVRLFTFARFASGSGSTTVEMAIDTGAPFSVLPYTLWHDSHLHWTLLGEKFARTPVERNMMAAPKWQNVDCLLGELSFTLVYPDPTRRQSRTLRLIAKLPLQSLPSEKENMIVLGLDFFQLNCATLLAHPWRESPSTLDLPDKGWGWIHAPLSPGQSQLPPWTDAGLVP